jgi:hypothetical protein
MIAKKKEGLKQREPGKKRSRIDQEQRSHRNATVCSPQHSHLEPSSTIAKKQKKKQRRKRKQTNGESEERRGRITSCHRSS